MKILHLNSESSWRGGEQQLLFLHQGLIDTGIESVVLCNSDSALGVKLTEAKLPHLEFSYRSSYSVNTVRFISRLCKEQDIDILHIHTSKCHTTAVLAGIFAGLKTKMVVSRRVDFPLKSNFLSRLKYNYHLITKIICVSHYIRKIVSEQVPSAKLSVVHSGIDFEKIKEATPFDIHQEFNVPGDKKLIGNVSAIADHKDYPTFIKAAELLSKRGNYHFVIVGDGPEKVEIEKLILEKNLKEIFTLTGFVKNPEAYLKSLDLLLFTSKMEGLGTVILNAFASETPIVSTNAGGIPEMFENESDLCPVGDPKQLADKVEQIIKGKSATTPLQNFEEEFSNLTMVKRTIDIYQSVLY